MLSKRISINASVFTDLASVSDFGLSSYTDRVDQNPPVVDLIWADPRDSVFDPSIEMVMIESCDEYFESARHTLVGLQHAAQGNSPLDKYLPGGASGWRSKDANVAWDDSQTPPTAAQNFRLNGRRSPGIANFDAFGSTSDWFGYLRPSLSHLVALAFLKLSLHHGLRAIEMAKIRSLAVRSTIACWEYFMQRSIPSPKELYSETADYFDAGNNENAATTADPAAATNGDALTDGGRNPLNCCIVGHHGQSANTVYYIC